MARTFRFLCIQNFIQLQVIVVMYFCHIAGLCTLGIKYEQDAANESPIRPGKIQLLYQEIQNLYLSCNIYLYTL
jgi:hypothetical protein